MRRRAKACVRCARRPIGRNWRPNGPTHPRPHRLFAALSRDAASRPTKDGRSSTRRHCGRPTGVPDRWPRDRGKGATRLCCLRNEKAQAFSPRTSGLRVFSGDRPRVVRPIHNEPKPRRGTSPQQQTSRQGTARSSHIVQQPRNRSASRASRTEGSAGHRIPLPSHPSQCEPLSEE